jgi:hypothetical protein
MVPGLPHAEIEAAEPSVEAHGNGGELLGMNVSYLQARSSDAGASAVGS